MITGLKENLQKISASIIQSRFNCAKSEKKEEIIESTLNNLRSYVGNENEMQTEEKLAASKEKITEFTISSLLKNYLLESKSRTESFFNLT